MSWECLPISPAPSSWHSSQAYHAHVTLVFFGYPISFVFSRQLLAYCVVYQMLHLWSPPATLKIYFMIKQLFSDLFLLIKLAFCLKFHCFCFVLLEIYWANPRNLKGGIGSLSPSVNAMKRRPYWPSLMEASYCTFGFGTIIQRDLRMLLLLRDSPRDNLYACMI